MKNSKRFLMLFSLLISGTLLFSACSKDNDDNPEPDPTPEVTDGTATASITFLDTDETVQFTGTAMGAIATGSRDSVIMIFHGKNTPMIFWLMFTPAKKGNYVMGENGFECYGFFYKDSTVHGIMKGYYVGVDNVDNDTEIDGAASFNISSISNDQIKGSFELTMIQNSTIYQNGELQSGEIKKLKVTNGKFDCPLFSADDFNFDGNSTN